MCASCSPHRGPGRRQAAVLSAPTRGFRGEQARGITSLPDIGRLPPRHRACDGTLTGRQLRRPSGVPGGPSTGRPVVSTQLTIGVPRRRPKGRTSRPGGADLPPMTSTVNDSSPVGPGLRGATGVASHRTGRVGVVAAARTAGAGARAARASGCSVAGNAAPAIDGVSSGPFPKAPLPRVRSAEVPGPCRRRSRRRSTNLGNRRGARPGRASRPTGHGR